MFVIIIRATVINPSQPNTTQSFIITGTHSITTEKLTGFVNYLSWTASVRMWFKGQGQTDHLTKRAIDIVESERTKWEQVNVQQCNLLWQLIDPYVIQLFRPFETCYKVWADASECYTNHSEIVHSCQQCTKYETGWQYGVLSRICLCTYARI